MGEKTYRKNALSLSGYHFLELVQFIVVLKWIYDKDIYSYTDENQKDNMLYAAMHDYFNEVKPEEFVTKFVPIKFAISQLHLSQNNDRTFEYLLSLLTMVTWLKLFFSFRFTKTFGPLYKCMANMMEDLLKFLVIWALLILMFACMAILAFSNIDKFQSFETTMIFFIEAALGKYDLSIFEVSPVNETEEAIDRANFLSQFGIYFMLVYLLINIILMLNFVIAIMNNSYAEHAGLKGVYYE